ncbi:MAG TPA: Ig-like domain repeat protein [Bryobacteraceae bacterium]|nr:Ig-like domain repeat protein [Bryobacteraceae bacterium]
MLQKQGFFLLAGWIGLAVGIAAQTGRAPRVTSAIRESQRIVLKGNTHPLARKDLDRGPAPDGLAMNRMLLVLKRSPEQDTDLKNLLEAQQNPASPVYHKWLSPEEFGRRFGLGDEDLGTVTSWLQSRGFRIDRIAKGRGVIEFSGTAGQVRAAFQTTIRKFAAAGVEHWANATDPSIPAALSPVVEGVASLNNFRTRSLLRKTPGSFRATRGQPLLNASTGEHFLVPADYAVAYNIQPLYDAGITGEGATIAVVAPTNFDVQDVADFRSLFQLSDNVPEVIVNGIDPGNPADGSETETALDATWSGAVAPGAKVKVVVSASTDTTDGADLSEIFIVDNNLADIVTESLGYCEAYAGEAYTRQLDAIRAQAAAQGITFIVSSGDGGLYGCDDFNTVFSVGGPVSVNSLASSPNVIAVGGTQFDENGNDAGYWSTKEDKKYGSLLKPIPETVWNESCAGELCFNNIFAASGGKSTVFPKPSWQAGVPGIPYDQARDLPDVSLTASSHDAYVVCVEGSCQQDPGGGFAFYAVSGTSASAPSFAGIMALINQKTGSRQGQANYMLYKLAALQNYSQCNGSSVALAASGCVFNDITTGNNAVPGQPGYGTPTAAYQAALGYDRATGLGSVNVANLANQWGSLGSSATATTLSISPVTLHGSPAAIAIGVSAASGRGVPSGQVSLLTSANQGVESFALTNGSATASTGLLPGGTYTVKAHYAGDGTFAPSDSEPVSVVIAPEASSVTLSAMTVDDLGYLTPFVSGQYGSLIYYSAAVAGASGFGSPSGTVVLNDNGTPISDSPVPLNTIGTAIFQPTDVPATGAHSLDASYGGDGSFLASTSPAVSFTIEKADSFLFLSPRCAPSPNPVTLEMDIGVNGYGAPPTGTVTFSLGGKTLGGPVEVHGFGMGGFAYGIATLSTSDLAEGQNMITGVYSGDANYAGWTTTQPVFSSTATCISDVEDSAGYYYAIAQDQFITIFGNNLASSSASAASARLPGSLAGTTVTITDSAGDSKNLLLSFVGPDQINGVIPAGVQRGEATLQIKNGIGTDEVPIFVDRVAPGLFSADSSGTGIAAANIIRIKSDGTQTVEPVAASDDAGNLNPVPIAFNGDRLVLELYGTGIRQRSSLVNTLVYFNGLAKIPTYAGAQSEYWGLDQVNVELPPSLAGAGFVDVVLEADGRFSNDVALVFR